MGKLLKNRIFGSGCIDRIRFLRSCVVSYVPYLLVIGTIQCLQVVDSGRINDIARAGRVSERQSGRVGEWQSQSVQAKRLILHVLQ